MMVETFRLQEAMSLSASEELKMILKNLAEAINYQTEIIKLKNHQGKSWVNTPPAEMC